MFNILDCKQFPYSTIANSNNTNPIELPNHLRIGNDAIFLCPDFACSGCRGRVMHNLILKWSGHKHRHAVESSEGKREVKGEKMGDGQ